MAFATPNFAIILPEMFLLGIACVALLADLFTKEDDHRWVYYIAQLGLVGVIALIWMQYGKPASVSFGNSFAVDNLAILLKLAVCATSFFALFYSRIYIKERDMPYGEYYVLALFSVLGMMVLVSANSFLTLFLGVELFSLPLYAMVALRRDSAVCSEAAMKYFVTGALATGMLLYGMSMIYGATKSIEIPVIANVLAQTSQTHNLIFIFGLVFVVAGIAFKLGVVPFHMWLPDVYSGAPSAVTLFLSAAPKIAAFGMMIRLLVEAMPSLEVQWQDMLTVLAVLSMAIGNFGAIVQSHIRRMLAYSAIAHMGYMLLGIIANTTTGYAAAMFYAISYAIMSLGAFGIIVMLNQKGFTAENIDDFKGLNSRNPWVAFIMLLTMFSMAGVPPLVGFMAKVGVLEALIYANKVWLAVIALLFAIIGVYYYIRVVKVMYFEEPRVSAPLKYPVDMQVAMTINGALILILGLLPGVLFNLCKLAF